MSGERRLRGGGFQFVQVFQGLEIHESRYEILGLEFGSYVLVVGSWNGLGDRDWELVTYLYMGIISVEQSAPTQFSAIGEMQSSHGQALNSHSSLITTTTTTLT